MPSSELEAATAEAVAAAKAAAEAALWGAVSEVIEDTEEARARLVRVAEDLQKVWLAKLSGQDTSVEEKWLEKEARLIAARLGVQASTQAHRVFMATVNVLMSLGVAVLSAVLKVPIPIPMPPAGGGGIA